MPKQKLQQRLGILMGDSEVSEDAMVEASRDRGECVMQLPPSCEAGMLNRIRIGIRNQARDMTRTGSLWIGPPKLNGAIRYIHRRYRSGTTVPFIIKEIRKRATIWHQGSGGVERAAGRRGKTINAKLIGALLSEEEDDNDVDEDGEMEKKPKTGPSHDRSNLFSASDAPSSQPPVQPPYGKLHCGWGSLRELLPLGNSWGERETFRSDIRDFGTVATKMKRNSKFSTLNDDDIRYFKGLLGEKNVVQDEDALVAVNMDWMHKYRGASKLMLQPRNTKEVSLILKYCYSRCLAVVPQGGNTGLVGGSVPVFDEVIVSLGAMNNIISFDKVSGILVCEAGCILESLVNFLDQHGFIMPLDLGAKGSCQIGGNVSTNAGGLRLLRYGSLHGNVLGLETVLANGDVLDMLGTLRKDNTGYDLKHLFIGSEGSLGIVTKVSILTPPKLPYVNVAFLACSDYSSCQRLLFESKLKLGEILSAFEFLDEQALDLALNHLEGVRNPLPPSMHNFYVLIETTGSHETYDKEKLEAFLVHSMELGLISDGVVAQDIQQASSVWRIREGIPEALMKAGAVYKYDLSIPVEKMYDLVDEMRNRLGSSARVVGYGHLGDGNLHLNISCPQYDEKVLSQIEPFVYEWTSKNRGSISAEHGVGLMKAEKIFYSKSPGAIQLMASIKNLLDPNGILNPYKVLPQSS